MSLNVFIIGTRLHIGCRLFAISVKHEYGVHKVRSNQMDVERTGTYPWSEVDIKEETVDIWTFEVLVSHLLHYNSRWTCSMHKFPWINSDTIIEPGTLFWEVS